MTEFTAWLPAIITALSAVFIAGQIAGRIRNQEKTLAKHDGRLEEHEDRLNDHDVLLAKSEAWRQGYNAGKTHH